MFALDMTSILFHMHAKITNLALKAKFVRGWQKSQQFWSSIVFVHKVRKYRKVFKGRENVE